MAMRDYAELIEALREEAEWAEANEYEAPIMLFDHLNQAADAIEELIRQNSKWQEAVQNALDFIPTWIRVEDALPENDVHVLLSCKCGAGAYVCDGFHTEKFSTPTRFYEDIDADYDEETDEYYLPEGWWEVINNWDDDSCVEIEDTVTHWMPLPEPPKEE